MTNNKKETMKEEWQKVRESFYYPQIPVPKFADDIPNACIDFSDLQIKVNPAYIDKLVQKGVNEHITLNAILGHEVGHFVDYPGSVLDLLRLHKVARESMNEKDAYTLREIFLNVQNNTNLVINRNYETIPPAIKPEVVESEGIGRVIYGLYQDLWKKDLGVNLKRSEKDLVSRLTGINYLNKGMQEQSLKKFINILGDYVKQENQKKSKDNNNKKGGGKGEKEDEGQSQESCLKGFSENQIREGIRQFAKESNPGEFEQIVGEILKEIEDKNQKGGPRSMEHQPYHKQGAGTEKGNIILARNIYSALAENFSIPIRKKQIKKNGSLYPHSHEEFGMSDSINDLDLFSSPGIIPGITQKWIRKEGETLEDFLGVPDSLIIMDSSGSMLNPDTNVSVPVLGATVEVNAYLNNGANCIIYNFSKDNIVVGPSKDKELLHKTLRIYQNGGTVFSTTIVNDIIKHSGNIDISIISDMDIHNLDEFSEYVSTLPNVHRVHLFYTTPEYIQPIAEKLKHKTNVAILPLYSQEDIRSITIGELRKSIR